MALDSLGWKEMATTFVPADGSPCHLSDSQDLYVVKCAWS